MSAFHGPAALTESREPFAFILCTSDSPRPPAHKPLLQQSELCTRTPTAAAGSPAGTKSQPGAPAGTLGGRRTRRLSPRLPGLSPSPLPAQSPACPCSCLSLSLPVPVGQPLGRDLPKALGREEEEQNTINSCFGVPNPPSLHQPMPGLDWGGAGLAGPVGRVGNTRPPASPAHRAGCWAPSCRWPPRGRDGSATERNAFEEGHSEKRTACAQPAVPASGGTPWGPQTPWQSQSSARVPWDPPSSGQDLPNGRSSPAISPCWGWSRTLARRDCCHWERLCLYTNNVLLKTFKISLKYC